MLYTVDLKQVINAVSKSATGHFNAVTFEKTENNRGVAFGSIYDMRQTGFNLLLASVVGRSFAALRNWRSSPGASIVNPVQLWTALTFDAIKIDAQTQIATSAPRTSRNSEPDPQLDQTIKVFTALGGRIIKISRTRPGWGFHYHRLEVMAIDANYTPAADLLQERTASGVQFVDASVFLNIGCRPPTLSTMASSRRLAAKLS